MTLKTKWIDTLHKIATGSRNVRNFFTPIGAIIYGMLIFLFIVIAMYGFKYPLPVEQTNWMKVIGNISGFLLVVGGLMLLFNRLGGGDAVGKSTAFDNFFLFVAIMVGFTGVATELGRLFLSADVALWLYICHLSFIMCLFVSS